MQITIPDDKLLAIMKAVSYGHDVVAVEVDLQDESRHLAPEDMEREGIDRDGIWNHRDDLWWLYLTISEAHKNANR